MPIFLHVIWHSLYFFYEYLGAVFLHEVWNSVYLTLEKLDVCFPTLNVKFSLFSRSKSEHRFYDIKQVTIFHIWKYGCSFSCMRYGIMSISPLKIMAPIFPTLLHAEKSPCKFKYVKYREFHISGRTIYT